MAMVMRRHYHGARIRRSAMKFCRRCRRWLLNTRLAAAGRQYLPAGLNAVSRLRLMPFTTSYDDGKRTGFRASISCFGAPMPRSRRRSPSAAEMQSCRRRRASDLRSIDKGPYAIIHALRPRSTAPATQVLQSASLPYHASGILWHAIDRRRFSVGAFRLRITHSALMRFSGSPLVGRTLSHIKMSLLLLGDGAWKISQPRHVSEFAPARRLRAAVLSHDADCFHFIICYGGLSATPPFTAISRRERRRAIL